MANTVESYHPVSQAKQAAGEATDTLRHAGAVASEQSEGFLSSVQEVAGDLAHKTAEGFGHLTDAASEYIDQGKRGIQAFGRTTQGQVRQRPIAAILVAAGAGVLLGAALMYALRR